MNRSYEFHYVYMNIAKEIAKLSRAERRKVGAVIVRGTNIISYGFNGTPSGFDNKCEDSKGETLPSVLHAETNAIIKANESLEGTTLYLTFSPCYACSKLILQAKISYVFYKDIHSDISGLDLLKEGGILVERI